MILKIIELGLIETIMLISARLWQPKKPLTHRIIYYTLHTYA
jgi:hypothetical protein